MVLADKFNNLKERISTHPRKKLILFLILFAPLSIIIFISSFFITKDLEKNKNDQSTSSQKTADDWQAYEESVKSGDVEPVSKILEVKLFYDEKASPQIKISGLTQKNGYTHQDIDKDKPYILQLLDSNNKVLSEQPFTIQTTRSIHIENPGKPTRTQIIKQTQVSFAVNLSWSDKAQKIRLVDKKVRETVFPVENVQIINNKPSFETISGDKLLDSQENKINFNFVPQVFAQESEKKVRITFISDQYTDMEIFDTDVDKLSKNLLTFEPFKTRASQVTFHKVANTDDLGCKLTPLPYAERPDENWLECDRALTIQKINSSGAPSDFFAVLNPNYFLSTGGDVISISTRIPSAQNVFVHEIGHGFGDLIEEYNILADEDGPIDNKTHRLNEEKNYFVALPTGDGNCYAGYPPAEEWKDLVEADDYRSGCTYRNWYAPSEKSIMSSVEERSARCFNKVSQQILNKKFDKHAGAFSLPVPLAPCPIGNSDTGKKLHLGDQSVTPTFACLGGVNCGGKTASESGDPIASESGKTASESGEKIASGSGGIGSPSGSIAPSIQLSIEPSIKKNCTKKYKNTPLGNFGDPNCDFDKDDLFKRLKELDPKNANKWFFKIVPCESTYNPNAFHKFDGLSPDRSGAWGLYQMGRGKNGKYDHGDVDWKLQTSNAVNYNKKIGGSFRYWGCAR